LLLATNKFIELLPGIIVNTFNLFIVAALVATTVSAIPVVERDHRPLCFNTARWSS
jgi:hypothetical protein